MRQLLAGVSWHGRVGILTNHHDGELDTLLGLFPSSGCAVGHGGGRDAWRIKVGLGLNGVGSRETGAADDALVVVREC